MNLKFLKTINRESPQHMNIGDMTKHLELLYKKCSNSAKNEFNED